MSVTTGTAVVGVFDTREQAQEAIQELGRVGFSADRIRLVALWPEAREAGVPEGPSGPPTFETGAGIGILSGSAVMGLALGSLPGLLAGALIGGALGAIIDLGIPETDARFYQDEAGAGRGIVIVSADGRTEEAAESLRRSGAREVRLPGPGTASDSSIG